MSHGNGTAPNMLGLLNETGTLTRAIGTNTARDCLKKSFNEPSGWIFFCHSRFGRHASNDLWLLAVLLLIATATLWPVVVLAASISG